MSRIGFPYLLQVVWGIKDFSKHLTPIERSLQPFRDVIILAKI
jgi:hypothetical protein